MGISAPGQEMVPHLASILTRARAFRLGSSAGEMNTIANVAGLDPSSNSATFGNSQVEVVLKIQPELCRQTKILSQANGGIGADGPVSADHFIDAGKVERFRQRIGAHAHRLHELGFENLSRVDRKYPFRLRHSCPHNCWDSTILRLRGILFWKLH